MHSDAAFIVLFAVATGVALIARWIKVPYTVALVVAGLALGSTHAFEPPHLTKGLLYAVFLPGLLFEAAFHLEFRKFLHNKLAIHALAVPGVAAAIALTAIILVPAANALHFVAGFGFRHALVFAAIIAATDPIAVVALFKKLGAPRRLVVLVEGESLLNDGTAVVLFGLILAWVAGRPLSIPDAALDFAVVVGMGALVGGAFGYLASKLTQQVDDPMIEITLTTIAGYGAFVAAEQFHYSGVIATVTAGMLCGNYGARTGMSPSTRVAVESFWEYVAFALNSIVFLLIGFEVGVTSLLASWKPILAAYVAVTAARAAVLYGVTGLLRSTRERIPWSWSAILTWGGLRGSLSMVLVLGLPLDFPFRDLLVTMTFGVVTLSILIQGLTMAPLLRRLGVAGARADREAYELQRGRMRSARAALAEIDAMARDGAVHADLAAALRADYGPRVTLAEDQIRALHLAEASLREEEHHAARRHLLLTEKDAVQSAFRQGLIGERVHETLMQDIDARLLRLEAADEAPAPPAALAPPAGGSATSG